MKRTLIAVIVMLTSIAGAAIAADVASLSEAGYVVVQKTSIKGDFDGCERGQSVSLANGVTFICASTGYTHAHNPVAVLMQNSHGPGYKLLVNSAAYDGSVSH